MSSPDVRDESPAVSLIFGLFAVAGLLFVSLLALSSSAWMGILFGAIELAVAWRGTPPSGALALRGITALMGAVTLLWSLTRLFL